MKRLFCLLCVLVLLVSCTPAPPTEDTVTITATTYPVYLFTLALTEHIPGIRVDRLDTGTVSCLHDYTLSVNDMKKIERADILALSGAGLEDFMTDALTSTRAHVIDCSQNIDLLPAAGHHDHGHAATEHDHYDPHYWLDPIRAQIMVDNLYAGLARALPQYDGPLYTNAGKIHDQLQELTQTIASCIDSAELIGIAIPGLITFHDGFQYLAGLCRTTILRSIEEEAGSEASARDLHEVISLIREYNVPVIFTEVNGAQASANAIAREAACSVLPLSMLMDGRDPTSDDSTPLTPYLDAMLHNVHTIIDGFTGTGGADPA